MNKQSTLITYIWQTEEMGFRVQGDGLNPEKDVRLGFVGVSLYSGLSSSIKING